MNRYIDCIIFYDDNLMFDIRFNTLKDYVDKFVVVESNRSHTGKVKKLNFDRESFKKYSDKIIYIVQDEIEIEKNTFSHPDDSIPVDDNWKREYSQRNYIQKGLEMFDDDDFILVSDTDEIPRPEEIIKIKSKKKYFYLFEQKNYMYKMNYFSHNHWYGSRMCLKGFLKSPNWLHKKIFPKKKFLYNFRKNIKIIQNGGWHFSYCRNIPNIVEKLENFAHQEFNISELKDVNFIEKSISSGKDFLNKFRIHDDSFSLKKVDIDSSYPKYIYDNQTLFKDFIL